MNIGFWLCGVLVIPFVIIGVLSSPSLFSMGTRERTGTTFQKVNYQMLYTIYVRKADYERAVHVITV